MAARARPPAHPAITGGVAATAAMVGAHTVLHRLGPVSGSTAGERGRALPGDDLVAQPSLVTNHAATLDAPPEQVWPWLTQVGWHRGGWYTPRWVDRLLFPDNWPSAPRLDPTLVRDLRPGDRIPDGPPGTAEFLVEVAQAPSVLVLHSRRHLAPGWDEKYGASLDWVWTFALDPRSAAEPGCWCATAVGCSRRGSTLPTVPPSSPPTT